MENEKRIRKVRHVLIAGIYIYIYPGQETKQDAGIYPMQENIS